MKQPKELVWKDEYINRFWNYMSRKPDGDQKYFTYQNGAGIVRFLMTFTKIDGLSILDYGCGKGFLIDHLISNGGVVSGLDYSEESVDSVNERFVGNKNWNGCILGDGDKVPYPDNSFDLVVCIETVEHVSDRFLLTLFSEIYRILKKDGLFLVTTPNSEVLSEGFVYCPNCEHVFHRMQHIRSWDKKSLSDFAALVKFEPVFVEGLNLRSFNRKPISVKSLLDLSLRKLFQLFEYYLYNLLGKRKLLELLTKKYNNRKHLVAVFKK